LTCRKRQIWRPGKHFSENLNRKGGCPMVPDKKKSLQMYKTMVAIRGFEESLSEVVDLWTLSPLDHETLSA
jgi:TPP-dependent pyruvate/acetoin dehydrogenase alpha subunit